MLGRLPNATASVKDGYYWSAAETEYASDLLFDHPKPLAELYPQFLHHGLSSFQCSDVLRFLDKNRPEVFCGDYALDKRLALDKNCS